MEKHKTGKYLKYAIGEIVLVVIGILIALQINNWNEERKAFVQSKNYLTEILKDLKSDTLIFNDGIKSITTDIKNEEWALGQTDYQSHQVDSLLISFSGWYFEYAINDRTFQKIQNTGASKLIGFDTLYDNITNYYTTMKEKIDVTVAWDKREVSERQEYMKELEQNIEISNYRMNILGLGHVIKDFKMKQDSLENGRLVIDFANSTRGRNHFKTNYIRHTRVLKHFEGVVQEANVLISAINKELENLEN